MLHFVGAFPGFWLEEGSRSIRTKQSLRNKMEWYRSFRFWASVLKISLNLSGELVRKFRKFLFHLVFELDKTIVPSSSSRNTYFWYVLARGLVPNFNVKSQAWGNYAQLWKERQSSSRVTKIIYRSPVEIDHWLKDYLTKYEIQLSDLGWNEWNKHWTNSCDV